MAMALRKSIYLSDEVLTKLSSIAAKKYLHTKDGNPNYLEAIRYIINEFTLDSSPKKDNKYSEKLDNMERMLEQMHVTIPHILYHTRYNSSYCHAALKQSKISEVSMLEFSGRVLKNVYQICGDFQSYNYHNVYLSLDNKNMNVIPIEEGENKWKLS
jgi:hypothetical protein